MTPTPEQQAFSMVQLLYERTRQKKVHWEQGSGRRVRAELDPYYVEMYSRPDPEFPEAPDYFIEVLDEQGRVVEEISNYTFRPFVDLKFEDLSSYQLLDRLYVAARRAAMGADKALEVLLKKLNEV